MAGTEIPTFVLKRDSNAFLPESYFDLNTASPSELENYILSSLRIANVYKQARHLPEIFRFILTPCVRRYSNAFLPGSYFDRDTVCRPVLETNNHLQLYIDEKTQKREDSRKKYEELNKYKEWWLVFVDYINYGDFDQLQKMWDFKHPWNKVILLNPENCKDAKEIS